MELPEGYEAHIVPRGSTFKNFGIIETNSMGIIDESYKETMISGSFRLMHYGIQKLKRGSYLSVQNYEEDA